MSANGDVKSAPMPVTRGLKPPILSQNLHWIEGTFKSRKPVDLPSILSQTFVETKPKNGYTAGSLFGDGRIHCVNPSRDDMGEHITWAGQAVDNCPIEPIELVKHLHKAEFSFTRLDLAIDAINFGLDARQATKELEHGRCKTRAKKSLTHSDPRQPGYTQNVGQFSSEIFLKLYDKAQEQGTVGDWTRIELTVRQSRANKAAWEIVRGTDFRGLVLAYCDFPHWPEWSVVMAADAVKLPKEQTIGNTEKWLLDSCAPALARVIFFQGSSDFYEKFKDEVMSRLEHLSNNRQTAH